MKNRTLVIGDQHGALLAVKQVLERCNFNKKEDQLINLGDVVDGWGQSSELVEFWINFKNDCVHKPIFLLGNHDCNHKDTEYLTDKGWLKFNEINNNTLLANFNKKGEIFFNTPLKRIEGFSEKLIKIEGNQTLQIVTPNHDVIINNKKVKAKKLLQKIIPESSIQICGNLKYGYENLDKIIQLIVWLVCDGTIVTKWNVKEQKNKVARLQFKLSKPDKIKKLKQLLDECNIKYTFKLCKKSGINKLQPYYIRIYTSEARKITKFLDNDIKEFPNWFLSINQKSINTLIQSLLDTDATIDTYEKYSLVSINKKDLDLLQILFCTKNIECHISKVKNGTGFKNGKEQYKLTFWNYSKTATRNTKLKISEIEYNDKVYCFEMPLQTLITRFEGKIAFSGNCWAKDWLNNGQAPLIWTQQGGQSTIDSYIRTGYLTKQSHRDFFNSCNLYYIDDKNRGFVHGGYTSRKGLGHEKYEADYYWDRDLWTLALMTEGRFHEEPNLVKDGMPSSRRFERHKEVYIGHTSTNNWNVKPHYPEFKNPNQAKQGQITIPMNRCNVWNLDTGSGFSGKLTIMDIDTKEFWQSDFVRELYPNEQGR